MGRGELWEKEIATWNFPSGSVSFAMSLVCFCSIFFFLRQIDFFRPNVKRGHLSERQESPGDGAAVAGQGSSSSRAEATGRQLLFLEGGWASRGSPETAEAAPEAEHPCAADTDGRLAASCLQATAEAAGVRAGGSQTRSRSARPQGTWKENSRGQWSCLRPLGDSQLRAPLSVRQGVSRTARIRTT